MFQVKNLFHVFLSRKFLGKLMAAFLSNKEDWERAAIKAGKRSGDLVSPLPYCPDLRFPDLKSSLADMKNSNLGKTEGPASAVAGRNF